MESVVIFGLVSLVNKDSIKAWTKSSWHGLKCLWEEYSSVMDEEGCD